jgi:hypothetical protein
MGMRKAIASETNTMQDTVRAFTEDDWTAGPRTGPLRFRQARFEDHCQIAALQSRYGLPAKPYEEWTHLWANNPVYREFHDWPIGWVFQKDDNEIVGHIANIPLSYEFQGRKLIAATCRGLVVDSRYRTYAFRLLRHFLDQKNIDLLFNTTANANASRAHEVFRTLRVPTGAWDRSSFWITNYSGFVASVFTKKQVPLAQQLSLPLSVGLHLKEKATWTRFKKSNNGFEIMSCSHFDQPFEDFWQALRRSRPGLLLATRSQAVLEWHFKYALAQKKAWIVVAASGSQLLAYSLFLRHDVPEYQLRRLRLIDFQTLEGKNESLVPMIDLALKRCRAEGVHMLEALGFPPDKQSIIDRAAPYKRGLNCWPYFYKSNGKNLAENLNNPTVWDPSCFDGDASL